jgi:hypothetical protein
MTAARQPIIMGQQITLRVRPGEMVRFPNRCAACGQPATERLPLQMRRGPVTRRLDAPLCADCARQLTRRSGREEQLRRTGQVAAVVTALGLLALVALLLGGPWWLRGLLGAAAGGAAAALVWWFFTRRAAAEQLPETHAVRAAARIVDFTWRDMTLELADETLAAAIVELNNAPLINEQLLPKESTDYTESSE